jgi:23S rRNA (pseudouridine1915-N3)-methyltransferase
MNIKILCPGKTKQAFVQAGIKEYLKRLSAYARVELIELQDVKLSPTNNIQIVKEKEAEIICRKIPENSYLIELDENGKQMDSIIFSKHLRKTRSSNLVFVIGGVYGLTEDLLGQADLRLSFSKMTFTHQMMRLILLEQLYRAFTISAGKKYHY